MTGDELARLLSEQAHAIAWEQRQAFIERTEELDAEAAARARRRLARKRAPKGTDK